MDCRALQPFDLVLNCAAATRFIVDQKTNATASGVQYLSLPRFAICKGPCRRVLQSDATR